MWVGNRFRDPVERDDVGVNRRPKEDVMQSTTLVDTAGRRRSPATLPGYHQGRPPRNKGLRYPADPPTVEEIIAVMGPVDLTSAKERSRLTKAQVGDSRERPGVLAFAASSMRSPNAGQGER
jgi:hypothetical protein